MPRNIDRWTGTDHVLTEIALVSVGIKEQASSTGVLNGSAAKASNKLQAFVIHGKINKVRFTGTFEAFKVPVIAFACNRIE